MTRQEARERIIVALDTPDNVKANGLIIDLAGAVGAFKLGLEFLHAVGPEGVKLAQAAGADRIFLDGKFCDIPNTVAGAVRSVCRLNPWMLNVHAMAGKKAMMAAMEAVKEDSEKFNRPRPLVIAVTVLTSLDDEALNEIGVPELPIDEVVRLAKLAQEAGLDGVVASPLEIEAVRAACGPDFLIVTPGIRPAGVEAHDQARSATPGAAIRSGADYLVIGRALTGADDPRAAAAAIVEEMVATV